MKTPPSLRTGAVIAVVTAVLACSSGAPSPAPTPSPAPEPVPAAAPEPARPPVILRFDWRAPNCVLLAEVAGGESKRLGTFDHWNACDLHGTVVRFEPSGRRVLFSMVVGYEDGNALWVAIADVTTGETTRLPSVDEGGKTAFIDGGRLVAFSRVWSEDHEIHETWLDDPDGGKHPFNPKDGRQYFVADRQEFDGQKWRHVSWGLGSYGPDQDVEQAAFEGDESYGVRVNLNAAAPGGSSQPEGLQRIAPWPVNVPSPFDSAGDDWPASGRGDKVGKRNKRGS